MAEDSEESSEPLKAPQMGSLSVQVTGTARLRSIERGLTPILLRTPCRNQQS